METIRIINCQDLAFSDRLSRDRLDQASEAFGADVIRRLLCFALYLLGLNRNEIGESLYLPAETVKSIIKTLMRDGLGALQDRRRKAPTFVPQPCRKLPPVRLKHEGQSMVVDFGAQDRQLKLSRHDPLQLRIVLLSMLNCGLLTNHQVAETVDLTPPHTKALAQRLSHHGAVSMVDRRQGQKQDYRLPAEIKAELIQQFAVDVITGAKTIRR